MFGTGAKARIRENVNFENAHVNSQGKQESSMTEAKKRTVRHLLKPLPEGAEVFL